MRSLLVVLTAAFSFITPAALAAEPALVITNGTEKAALSVEDFARLPHIEIKAFDGHAKQEHTYSGVPVRDLLNLVRAPLGEKLRGAALQSIVRAQSKDGYAVVFALAEFDDAFTNRTIVLADREDRHALRESAAPFQLIAVGDKRPARWARMVTALEITTATKP